MKLALLHFSLVVVAVTVCRGEFCDEGPPGKYCLEDLSGYHDCHVDPKTKKMVDTVHKCTVAGTRCQCFWGPPCAASVQDPCAKYQAAPSFPPKFSLYTDIQEQHCNETKCSDVIFRQDQAYQDEADQTKQKFRNDNNLNNYEESVIYLQKNASEFTKYSIRFDTGICTKGTSPTIPKLHIDPRFNCNAETEEVEKCVLKTGGHNSSQSTTSTTWYLRQNDRYYWPVMFTSVIKVPKDKTNQTLHAEMNITPNVDEKMFDPPYFCK